METLTCQLPATKALFPFFEMRIPEAMHRDIVLEVMADTDPNILSGGPTPFDIPPVTVGQMFFKALSSNPPDETILIEAESGRSVTTGEYLNLSVRIAEALKEAGVEPGDAVVLAGKNGIDISLSATAALYLGAAMSPIDPSMKSFEFQQILKIISPKAIFCDSDITSVISDAVPNLEKEVTVVLLHSDPDTEYPFPRFEDFIKADVDMSSFRPVPSEDTTQSIALLACSSGTTGLPKAVMLSDRGMVFQIFSWRERGNSRRGGKAMWLHTSHFFWITGISLFLACTCGAERRVLVRNVTSENILKAIDEYKAQVCCLAPAHLDMILNDPNFDKYDVSSIKLITAGGAALQKATYDNIISKWRTPVCVIQGYGCTEVGGLFTSMSPGQDIASVGEPIPGTQIKVLKEDGTSGGPEEIGELCLKSESIMNGYVKNEEATKNALDEDGWLHTGDTGYYKNGLVYICGRIKELIKYKGMQIAPAELEELIKTVPGVVDVGVAGIKIDAYTYHPMALVVKGEGAEVTEEDIVKCVNENLSEYKQLRGGVCFVEAIPRTPTGKIKRNALQELAETLYMGD